MTANLADLVRPKIVDALNNLEDAISEVSEAQRALARAGCIVSVNVSFQVLALKPRAMRKRITGKRAVIIIAEKPE